MASFLRLSDFFYDFKIARTIEGECRRQFENYGTLNARPDGVGPGRLPSYAMFEFRENQPILKKYRSEEYDWFTPMLNREYRDRMLSRARYMLGMHALNGEQIVTQKTDRRGNNFSRMVAEFNRTLPELFDESAMMKIANRIIRNQMEPSWNGQIYQQKEKPIAQMGMGSVADDEPEFSSYGYPYDRIFVMGSGWNLKQDQYGVFLGSTVRGYGDSFMKENKACNHFNLSAFDEDLFNNGIDYAYNYLSSPVTVDGQTQFNGAGEGPTSRRGMGNFGLDPICQDRIHFSDHFDMVEGLYDGAYANTGDHNPEYYDYENKLAALKRSIWGCSHHRIVQFVKQHGLWIVIDVMTADKPREYAQQWWLGEFSKELPEGFRLEQFQTYPQEQMITMTATNRACFTMYHVGPAELDQPAATNKGVTYAPVGLKPEVEDTFKGARADRHEGREYIELKGSWKSQGGRSQLITVINPLKSDQEKPLALTRLMRSDGQVNGFTATLKDGAEVSYLAAIDKPERLSAGGICALAESLLVLREADGTLRGTLLGCSELKQMPPSTETGVDMTTVCLAIYTKEESHAPDTWSREVKPGLAYEYFEAQWPFLLFGPNREVTPVVKRGEVPTLFDTAPAEQKEQAFAFAYTGFIDVPVAGVYTLYAPKEFSHYRPLACYDLSVALGYQNRSYNGKQEKLGGGSPLNAWYPATRRHAFGTWSVVLEKGLQPFARLLC